MQKTIIHKDGKTYIYASKIEALIDLMQLALKIKL